MKSLRLLIVVSVIVLILPIAAMAGTSMFDDVPDSNMFVDDINWLKTNDITKGCNAAGTEFCPEAPVLRQEMAAFMHRLATSNAVNAGTLSGRSLDDFVFNYGWETKSDQPFIPAHGTKTVTLWCPTKKYVVSGSGQATNSNLQIYSSYPVSAFGVSGYNGWQVSWVNDSATDAPLSLLTVWALCAGKGQVVIP